jgi:hypothetical protein
LKTLKSQHVQNTSKNRLKKTHRFEWRGDTWGHLRVLAVDLPEPRQHGLEVPVRLLLEGRRGLARLEPPVQVRRRARGQARGAGLGVLPGGEILVF